MSNSAICFAMVCSILVLHSQAAYLSFARGGRSNNPSCCLLGIKSEWHTLSTGAVAIDSVTCPQTVPCCEGMQEIIRTKADGSLYTICIYSNAVVINDYNNELSYESCISLNESLPNTFGTVGTLRRATTFSGESRYASNHYVKVFNERELYTIYSDDGGESTSDDERTSCKTTERSGLREKTADESHSNLIGCACESINDIDDDQGEMTIPVFYSPVECLPVQLIESDYASSTYLSYWSADSETTLEEEAKKFNTSTISSNSNLTQRIDSMTRIIDDRTGYHKSLLLTTDRPSLAKVPDNTNCSLNKESSLFSCMEENAHFLNKSWSFSSITPKTNTPIHQRVRNSEGVLTHPVSSAHDLGNGVVIKSSDISKKSGSNEHKIDQYSSPKLTMPSNTPSSFHTLPHKNDDNKNLCAKSKTQCNKNYGRTSIVPESVACSISIQSLNNTPAETNEYDVYNPGIIHASCDYPEQVNLPERGDASSESPNNLLPVHHKLLSNKPDIGSSDTIRSGASSSCGNKGSIIETYLTPGNFRLIRRYRSERNVTCCNFFGLFFFLCCCCHGPHMSDAVEI